MLERMLMMKRYFAFLLVFCFLAATLTVVAQSPQAQARVLRPPAGAKVALVVFEDMQCPDCARAEPLLLEAVAKYKIPLVRHDFPLPQHDWAFDAHVIARWFDTQSPALGEKFRSWVLTNQSQINKGNLRSMADRFAAQNGTSLPFILDPKKELAAKVNADRELGRQVGIQHTPTIYVVSNSRTGQPFIEVVDRRE
ncbi:MAG TPA: thioredoxin domain-containing protein, partial [Prosthecobacter sp.]|nr:thioredoxin domain-containing protein [Prosthecobacter sp.]